jgi:hypothetical protein
VRNLVTTDRPESGKMNEVCYAKRVRMSIFEPLGISEQPTRFKITVYGEGELYSFFFEDEHIAREFITAHRNLGVEVQWGAAGYAEDAVSDGESQCVSRIGIWLGNITLDRWADSEAKKTALAADKGESKRLTPAREAALEAEFNDVVQRAIWATAFGLVTQAASEWNRHSLTGLGADLEWRSQPPTIQTKAAIPAGSC